MIAILFINFKPAGEPEAYMSSGGVYSVFIIEGLADKSLRLVQNSGDTLNQEYFYDPNSQTNAVENTGYHCARL